MDTSRKVNANAGKGGKYRPGDVTNNFGEPNMVAPGSGVSSYAWIRTQAHSRGAASGQPRTDKSTGTSPISKPGLSVGNVGYRLHHILKNLAGKLRQIGIDGSMPTQPTEQ